ncbi:MAG: type III secretion inner membrane ring lipoprotein SctJ [Candidatus Algichlamydia australiensis]|nr:type III secretion inner membrane ring lipoprotein SctJ [Chlamydiales bacterium]
MILKRVFSCLFLLLLFAGCEKNQAVITNVEEREANVVVVFLESKGIPAMKVKAASSEGAAAGDSTKSMFNIIVPETQAVDAMSYLNQAGLPRKQGTNLLQLFSKQGLMSSDKEETIRYQAGLAQQITNIILRMDGVLDASVQISFPPQETLPGEEQTEQITAAVYVKHQGIFEDPNMQMESKIKRLVSGSVSGLDINDVTVVSDKARYTDIAIDQQAEWLSDQPREYVSIWSVVMSQSSAGRFRFIFFTLLFFTFTFVILAGWMAWKLYPVIKRKGFKEILNPKPILMKELQPEEQPAPEPPESEG